MQFPVPSLHGLSYRTEVMAHFVPELINGLLLTFDPKSVRELRVVTQALLAKFGLCTAARSSVRSRHGRDG